MGNLTIRPSKRGDIENVLQKRYRETFRGVTVEEDGEIVGIAGVLHGRELQAFSTLNFDTRQDRRFMVKAVREYRKILEHYDLPIYAQPDPNRSTAQEFLGYVGFEERDDGLFVWTPSQ